MFTTISAGVSEHVYQPLESDQLLRIQVIDELNIIVGDVAIVKDVNVLPSNNSKGWDISLGDGLPRSDPRFIELDIDTTSALEVHLELFLNGEYWSSSISDDTMVALYIRAEGQKDYVWSNPLDGKNTVFIYDRIPANFNGVKYFEFGYQLIGDDISKHPAGEYTIGIETTLFYE
ncbi:hypothetical protein N9N03_00490 [Chlamydiia bacterium]|nr:hypothetical protein [Chlamydiia bacterium]